jgi:HEPN domain-containing protein
VNRERLKAIAAERLEDAKVLLKSKRWSGAYYLCGYAIECGLKACVLRYVGESTALFGDSDYLKRLSQCWTHDLVKLVNLAGLDELFGQACGADPKLLESWTSVKDWDATFRYADKSEADAKALYEAVSDKNHGVLSWIQEQW